MSYSSYILIRSEENKHIYFLSSLIAYMNKKSLVLGIVGASVLFASQVSAHTTVKPASVGVAKFQTFTVSVPSEKPIATVGIRLVLPEGLNYVSPNVKPGWKVEVKKAMVGSEEKVVEINWTGGSIPKEMRDEFNFSAQVPSKPVTLAWKAYQTYADGTVVAWDQDPAAKQDHGDDFSTMGPYSKTEVIDDLSSTSANPTQPSQNSSSQSTVALAISVVALVLSIGALKKKTQK